MCAIIARTRERVKLSHSRNQGQWPVQCPSAVHTVVVKILVVHTLRPEVLCMPTDHKQNCVVDTYLPIDNL